MGINLLGANNNTIQNNVIKQNKKIGINLFWSSDNQIEKNNFISNRFEAYFDTPNIYISCYNRWSGNYWNRPRILPKPIFGRMGVLPWVNFDWHPAREPYDIGGVIEYEQ